MIENQTLIEEFNKFSSEIWKTFHKNNNIIKSIDKDLLYYLNNLSGIFSNHFKNKMYNVLLKISIEMEHFLRNFLLEANDIDDFAIEIKTIFIEVVDKVKNHPKISFIEKKFQKLLNFEILENTNNSIYQIFNFYINSLNNQSIFNYLNGNLESSYDIIKIAINLKQRMIKNMSDLIMLFILEINFAYILFKMKKTYDASQIIGTVISKLLMIDVWNKKEAQLRNHITRVTENHYFLLCSIKFI